MSRAFSQDLIHLFFVPGLGVLNEFLPRPGKCLPLVGWTEQLFLSTLYADRCTSMHKVTACMMYSHIPLFEVSSFDIIFNFQGLYRFVSKGLTVRTTQLWEPVANYETVEMVVRPASAGQATWNEEKHHLPSPKWSPAIWRHHLRMWRFKSCRWGGPWVDSGRHI